MTSSFLCFCCLLVQWSSAALFTTSLTLLWHKTDSAKPRFSVYGFPAGEGGGTARLRRAEPSCPLPKRRPVSLAPCTSCSSAAGRQQGQTAELPRIYLCNSPWAAEKHRAAALPMGVPCLVRSVQGSGQYPHRLYKMLATRPATSWPTLQNEHCIQRADHGSTSSNTLAQKSCSASS